MDNYYVQFTGELKDDRAIQERYFKHYNTWCNTINEYIPKLNELFDDKWVGEPITDYSENEEYERWMILNYRRILRKSGLGKDLLLKYEIGDELELVGVGRYGSRKGKRISFVLKKG